MQYKQINIGSTDQGYGSELRVCDITTEHLNKALNDQLYQESCRYLLLPKRTVNAFL